MSWSFNSSSLVQDDHACNTANGGGIVHAGSDVANLGQVNTLHGTNRRKEGQVRIYTAATASLQPVRLYRKLLPATFVVCQKHAASL